MRYAYDPFHMGDLNDLRKHTKHDLHRRLVDNIHVLSCLVAFYLRAPVKCL